MDIGIRCCYHSHLISQEHFLGHALQDRERVIIHHYNTAGAIGYPNFPSGWAVSSPVLHK